MLRINQFTKINKLALGVRRQCSSKAEATTVTDIKLPTEADVVIIGNF